MTKTLERHGLLICSISILMVTQLRWADSRNYGDIAVRLSAAILLGTLLTWGLGKWLTIMIWVIASIVSLGIMVVYF